MNIAVAQSGGPTAAINSSLCGVFDEAEKYNEIDRIYGSLNGIEGILNDNLIDLKEVLITENDKQLLKRTPSTVLGSCRFKLKNSSDDDSDYKRITQTFAKYDIKAFFYIGGNDSMDTVMKLDAYFRENHIDIKVVGVPKTIDNDLPLTDHTPGFGSAAKYVATTLQEIIRDSRVYSIPSVTIVEIMGRDAGWLTASSCVLRANGEQALLAFHHVDEAHRHADDERGAQAVFDLLRNGEQGRGRVADGQDGPGVLLRSLVHGGHGAGGACRFGLRRHGGVGHITERLCADFCKAGLGDACAGHVGVGDDDGPFVEGGHGVFHRAGGEAQILGVIEIRRGVDDPLDHRRRLGGRGKAQLGQLGGDDGKARPLDIGGQMMLRRQYSIPFRAATPFW